MEATAGSTHRWVIFSTFDANGAPAPFAGDQLRAYRALGFDVLVVDTSPEVSEERAAIWEACSTRWLRRQNVGYDFGSYRWGLANLVSEQSVSLSELDVLFTNDSCYGPFTSLANVFERFDAMPRNGRSVFAMTDSHERGFHLQSYWLYFRSDVLPLAVAYFAQAPTIEDRSDAVAFGELGLSRYLIDAGCELLAWMSMRETVQHFARFHGRLLALLELGVRWKLNRPRYTRQGDKACLNLLLGRPFLCNQTAAFGSHLHYQSMMPFVKRQLVRENPNWDPILPWTPPADARDNDCVDRWLRSSDRYRRRYGGERHPAPLLNA